MTVRIIAGIWLGLVALWCAGAGLLLEGYRRGYRRGHEEGYQEGYELGRTRADGWWMNLEYETLAAQKQIRREDRREETG